MKIWLFYKCNKCGATFSAESPVVCPACGSTDIST